MRFHPTALAPFLLAAAVAYAGDPPSSQQGQQGQPTQPANEAQPPAAAPAPNGQAPAPSAPAPAGGSAITPAPTLSGSDAAVVSPEAAKAQADLNRIRARANEVEPKLREATEKNLHDSAADVDAATAKKDKVEVAGRLAAEFGGAPELYIGERDRLKTGWGQLTIAHTILSNAKTTVTIDQLFDLRQEGLGWGQIAHGLDLNVGEFTAMAHAKGRAAVGAPGQAKGDAVEAKADMGAKGKADVSAKGKAVGKGAAKAQGAATTNATTKK